MYSSQPITFWGTTIKPECQDLAVPQQFNLHITNAALTISESSANVTSGSRTLLWIISRSQAEDFSTLMNTAHIHKILLCTFISQKFEQQNLDITIAAGESMMLEVSGDGAIALSGNILNAPQTKDPTVLGTSQTKGIISPDDQFHDASENIIAGVVSSKEPTQKWPHADTVVVIEDTASVGNSEDVADREPPPKRPRVHPAMSMSRYTASARTAGTKGRSGKNLLPEFLLVANQKSVVIPSAKAMGKRRLERSVDAEQLDSESSDCLTPHLVLPHLSSAALPISASAHSDARSVIKKTRRLSASGVSTLKSIPSKDIVGIMDHKAGDGDLVAARGDTVTFWYKMQTANETVVHSCLEGTPFQSVLGQGKLLKAIDDGMLGMKMNREHLMKIPPACGYGSQQRGPVPPNSMLFF